MSLISLTQVSYSLEGQPLFSNLSFAIEAGERTALVGMNGAGKSTLLRLIAGELDQDSGVIARRSGTLIERVPQTLPDSLRNVTLFDSLAHKIPESYRFSGFEYLIEQRLSAAGFGRERHQQRLGTLSGGEVNRALLARALVNEPDVVLLDEPTNHMDIGQIASFERFLQEEQTVAMVIVSHDRTLLDSTTTRTLFLRDQRIYPFDLPFSEARHALADADSAARARRKSEEREVQRLRDSAHRLAEWGRVYSNEKFSYRAKSMEKRISKLEARQTVLPQTRRADVCVDTTKTTSPSLLDINDLTLSTPDGKHLGTIEKLSLRRGERLAIVGRNGCGKSTLMRTIVARWAQGSRSPNFSFNPAMRLGYYDQELSHFSSTERVAEAVLARCHLSQHRVVSELVTAGFLFERHKQLVATLSGGERSRLTFLILKLLQPHLLVLDEPTNHLDVEGIEQLEETLIDGEVTTLLVSHDRSFLERVTTRLVRMEELSGC
jgi:ATPase subunit of ABC transporter with duplicated ATPase domains